MLIAVHMPFRKSQSKPKKDESVRTRDARTDYGHINAISLATITCCWGGLIFNHVDCSLMSFGELNGGEYWSALG